MMSSSAKACVALVAVVGLLVLAFQNAGSGSAHPLYTVKELMDFHNTTDTTATDFHVKIWQKEENIHIVDYDVGNPQGGGTCVGTPGNRPNMSVDTGTHAVDVDCQGISIPPDGHLKFSFAWRLTSYNTKRLWEPTWTQSPDEVKAAPSHGIEVDYPVPHTGSMFNHPFLFCNDDPVESLNMKELKLGSASPPLFSFEELESFDTWDLTLGPFTLDPEECYDVVNVVTDGYLFGGNIVASYTLTDTGAAVLLEDKFDHEISPPPGVGGMAELPNVASDSGSSAPPYAAIAGIAAAGALALTAGAWYARRRLS